MFGDVATDAHRKQHERDDQTPLKDRVAEQIAGQGG